jgi:hypothetical protein
MRTFLAVCGLAPRCIPAQRRMFLAVCGFAPRCISRSVADGFRGVWLRPPLYFPLRGGWFLAVCGFAPAVFPALCGRFSRCAASPPVVFPARCGWFSRCVALSPVVFPARCGWFTRCAALPPVVFPARCGCFWRCVALPPSQFPPVAVTFTHLSKRPVDIGDSPKDSAPKHCVQGSPLPDAAAERCPKTSRAVTPTGPSGWHSDARLVTRSFHPSLRTAPRRARALREAW